MGAVWEAVALAIARRPERLFVAAGHSTERCRSRGPAPWAPVPKYSAPLDQTDLTHYLVTGKRCGDSDMENGRFGSRGKPSGGCDQAMAAGPGQGHRVLRGPTAGTGSVC